MKCRLFVVSALALLRALSSQLSTLHAQGTAFTYQGRLNDGANAAHGSYDLTFSLWNAATGPAQLGGTMTNAATAVSNGLFTVMLDFGNPFPGADRWLEIGVRTNGGATFSNLVPRQKITPTPYAIFAAGASAAGTVTGVVPAGQISGTLPLAQLPAVVLTNGASGVNLAGTFSGNGAGVTNVNLALNSGGAIALSGTFVLASSPGVGLSPYAVVAADVNGDGKVDLISANYPDGTLTVLTNNGSGGFVLASSPGDGGGPYSVVAADVNGDGKVDLICANYGANTLSVLTNNGSGGFVLASSPGVGGQPRSVVAADVNGDGKVDLISANQGANTVSVLTNNGSGGFVLASSPGVGFAPYAVVAADVNGDGKVDLITANYADSTLTVLTNNGSGGFVLASSPVVGSGPYSVVAADVNGDGKVDLVSANVVDNTLTVLTNNGGGGFVLASSLGVGALSYSVVAADVNGDGKVDLISASFSADTLTVLTNNGSGGFALASSMGVGSGPIAVVAADVNGDGNVDLICAAYSDSTLTVLFNTPTFRGIFNGNGAGLGSLSAANLIGSVPAAALTSVPAGSLTGTIADARLSANVALRTGGNAFTGDQTMTGGNVGIGVTTPGQPLQVGDQNLVSGSQGMMRFGSHSATQPYSRYWDIGVPKGDTDISGKNYSFVIDDPQLGTAPEFLIRWDTGFVGIGKANPATALDVNGTVTATAFNPPSDRNLKENFAPVSPRDVLDKVAALPISRWNFIGDAATPHVGPMAQDFHAAFGLGTDDRHIATVDADGVALAAIQGLNQKLAEQEAALKTKDVEIQGLRQAVAELQKTVCKITHQTAE